MRSVGRRADLMSKITDPQKRTYKELRSDVTYIPSLWVEHAILPKHVARVCSCQLPRFGQGREDCLHQVRTPIPAVTKNPQTHPRTLQLQARARIARQTYSPKRRSAAFCQERVRNLISCASSSMARAVKGSTSASACF